MPFLTIEYDYIQSDTWICFQAEHSLGWESGNSLRPINQSVVLNILSRRFLGVRIANKLFKYKTTKECYVHGLIEKLWISMCATQLHYNYYTGTLILTTTANFV